MIRQLTMSRNRAESSHNSNFESSLSDSFRETRVSPRSLLGVIRCLLKEVPESTTKPQISSDANRNGEYNSLEVANLTKESTSNDDSKSYPESPDVTAENGDDFMSEERRKADDKHNHDWDEPSRRKFLHPNSRRSKLVLDLLVEDGDKGSNDANDYQHEYPNCIQSSVS
jgi:hypothetical protein